MPRPRSTSRASRRPNPRGLVNTVIDYDYGTSFNYNDMAGFITNAPIVVKKLIPTYVPQVDSDGNELLASSR